MKQATGIIAVETKGQGFTDVTRDILRWAGEAGMREGLLTLFIRHTSASLLIQENADPDVLADLGDALDRLAPRDGGWRHDAEGPDDMPAHIRAALTQTHLAIPLIGGRLALGTWQGIYLVEHRDRPHRRELALHLIGE
ncbi:secondary thiamine-phosphate synthase enzyme [Parvibaculum indicum]|uniref:secondary thiamine-phosphate synthase enzyme YjbQ n=1 Tax=Parvibaculum indicum TaxID=562969 RepID=UPI00141E7251|nr:secondary thiamine-phosphate synthase enzyme YjbQ [Parvibaculum indicum]NIJ42939.1 secondary thiamine-phosphate synthase enzyme [Parvibaculum indicum]